MRVSIQVAPLLLPLSSSFPPISATAPHFPHPTNGRPNPEIRLFANTYLWRLGGRVPAAIVDCLMRLKCGFVNVSANWIVDCMA